MRLHAPKLIKDLEPGEYEKAQLGLGHSFSRMKIADNPKRSDNNIIQAIALLDQLDKDINTFSMRVREWYSWHFPELVKLVNENYKYAQLVRLIKDKANLQENGDAMLHDIAAIVDEDAGIAQSIIEAANVSMGQDISEIDMINVVAFAERVVALAQYRTSLHAYLVTKMSDVAPNLAALIGEMVGARLIAHAGSLVSLAKYPASTVQILGAEKALFRALKTKGNTPKYGLIYNSTFIGRANPKNKGRISRYLANKCSIASRIDSFTDDPTTVFGKMLRSQVEERLAFFDTGSKPRRNEDAMKEAMDSMLDNLDIKPVEEDKKKTKKSKRKHDEDGVAELSTKAGGDDGQKKKKKKSKKDKDESESKEERKRRKEEKKQKRIAEG